jgi:enamine deaminase RidA (YjgF/YER057c/UK114 family)
VRAGDLLFLAGQGADGWVGRLGADLEVEQGRLAARDCALNLLAQTRDALGSLDRVAQVVKVVGFVACTPGFTGVAAVVAAASTLLLDLFGARGRHARSAVGVAALPMGFAVEVEMRWWPKPTPTGPVATPRHGHTATEPAVTFDALPERDGGGEAAADDHLPGAHPLAAVGQRARQPRHPGRVMAGGGGAGRPGRRYGTAPLPFPLCPAGTAGIRPPSTTRPSLVASTDGASSAQVV